MPLHLWQALPREIALIEAFSRRHPILPQAAWFDTAFQRAVPRSRQNPQFNRDIFYAALEVAGIRYEHVAGLGGFRRTQPGSLNLG